MISIRDRPGTDNGAGAKFSSLCGMSDEVGEIEIQICPSVHISEGFTVVRRFQREINFCVIPLPPNSSGVAHTGENALAGLD